MSQLEGVSTGNQFDLAAVEDKRGWCVSRAGGKWEYIKPVLRAGARGFCPLSVYGLGLDPGIE